MKKYFLFSIIVFSALWVLNVHQTKAAATLKVSGNGHYIEKLDGTPFLYLGDLDWVINMKYSDAEIDALLADRQTNGFTVIAAAPAPDWGSVNDDRKDYYGNSPFINDDITQFNAAYWNRWRGIADKCANRGLYLALTYGGPGVGAYSPWYADTDYKRYEYGRKIGDTFKDKTNVIFINSEDKDGDAGVGVDGWRIMAEGVADGANGVNNFNGSADYSTTFMSFHPDGPYGSGGLYNCASSVWFHTDSWLDVNGIQTWAYNSEIYSAVNADYNKTNPVKPVILLEAGFEAFDYSPYTPYGSYITPHDVRVSAFHTYFAGGAGYTYAHGYSFQQGYSVYDYINSVGAQHMKVLKDFMSSREWWKFVPDQGIISSGVDSGVNRKVAVKSTDGDECYVYYPTVSSANIRMNCITTNSNVDATWFDPRNGNTQSAGIYTTSQTVSLTPPSSWEDAVLFMKAGSAGPYCGDSSCNGEETCSTCPTDCGQCPVLSNNSQFVSQSVPSQMTVGSNYTASVAIKNTGTSVWTEADMYRLGSQNPYDNTTWGMGRVSLGSSEAINPGQTKTFTFSATAPATLGTYNFQWRMVKETVEWFGELTPNISVSVISQATPYCGDSSCNGTETCLSCSSDCGVCPVTPPVLPGWTFCASENEQCSFSGTKEVQYGANSQYFSRTFTNGVLCANSIFGDPIVGVTKYCYYRSDTTPPAAPTGVVVN